MEIYTLSPNPVHAISKLIFGDSWDDLRHFLPGKPVILVTDSTVYRLYESYFTSYPCVITEPGENNKQLESVQSILNQLLEFGADRNSLLLAVGGGVVGDMGGLAASLYMRGISFGYVPTTLLAMTDASIGGKTAVNLGPWKNIIGTFTQPEFVYILPQFLATQSDRDFCSGMAEIIKHAFIGIPEAISYIRESHQEIWSRKSETLFSLIRQSVLYKSAVVEQDEKELGLRAILNFGHTFGHAIEEEGRYTHGESVALGMMLAARISEIHCELSPAVTQELKSLLQSFSLPVDDFPSSVQLIHNIRKDKKKSGNHIRFVYLTSLGNPRVELSSFELLEFYLHKILPI